MPDRPCPPEHATDIARLQERTRQNTADIKDLDTTVNDRLAKLEKTIEDGLAAINKTLTRHAMNDARRTGAEKLGAWLIGTMGVIGTVVATIWAALHNSVHH